LDILASANNSQTYTSAIKSSINMLTGKQPLDREKAVEVWQLVNLALLNR
jgi:hypothetical protein